MDIDEKQTWRVVQRYHTTLAGFCERGRCANRAVALLADQEGRGMQVCRGCEDAMVKEGTLSARSENQKDQDT
jgi:hypothetical protein